MLVFTCASIILLAVAAQGENCPSGGFIYERGISEEGKTTVINSHNKYRKDIANGLVKGQPRGIDLKRMSYDKVLGVKGRTVSNTCKMQHVIAKDDRWPAVGQNLYIEWSSVNTTKQNWQAAVDAWFNEHKVFTYPNKSKGVTGHYTQVVWSTSNKVGCDYIRFYDPAKPKYPYTKLYTCNYGPAGNYVGKAPYQTGKAGCENLC